MLISPTLWKKFVLLSTFAHLSVIQFFPITCLMFKGLGTWEHLFSHRCGKSNARLWRQQLWRKSTISSTHRKKLCHFRDVRAYPGSTEIFSNNVLARTFIHHPPPSTIKHSLHKCLGKAFPNYRGVCHSSWKWNASQLQTTTESISELICCDEASVHLDNVMHARSGEVLIQLKAKNKNKKHLKTYFR